MNAGIDRLHHVTAITGDPQTTVNFYSGILGLRLVKRTVNFDDPGTYHLYFGDYTGTPGSLITFFPWSGAAAQGKPGNGQAICTSYSIPAESLGFWKHRLSAFNIDHNPSVTRFGLDVLRLHDPDGIAIEIVADPEETRDGCGSSQIHCEHSIRGFHGVLLSVEGYEATASLLVDTLGFSAIGEDQQIHRFSAGSGGPGTIVDLWCRPQAQVGLTGPGSVHHVAWNTTDDATQAVLRERLLGAGMNVTPVMDRNYFHSVYFREPNGVLFEVATSNPGFMIDESDEHLGNGLMLPPWLERDRQSIESRLPPITVPAGHGPEVRL